MRFTLRPASQDDTDILVAARRHMYEDMGETNAESLGIADARFASWLREHLHDGQVLGYIAQTSDGAWLGALSAHVEDVCPSMGNPTGRQHYLFGLWVRPESRRSGVGTALVVEAVDRAKADGAGAVLLMASDHGRLVYERLGFEAAPAMRLFFDPMP